MKARILALVAMGVGFPLAAAAQPQFDVAPLPVIEGPITAPGAMHIDAVELAQEQAVAALAYVFEEYFVSGTAGGAPYKVRMLVARPADLGQFSGQVLVEPKHPLGIPFIWNFTRLYLAPRGHVAVELSTFIQNLGALQAFNPERYGDLQLLVDPMSPTAGPSPQTSEIFAQVGRLLKSDRTPLPSRRPPPPFDSCDERFVRKRCNRREVLTLYMTGHSMSAGPSWTYMNSVHARLRLEDGAPIYDGFFPETSRTAARMGPYPDVDVPTVAINSQLEVEEIFARDGIDYRKPDSDERGQQFRLYEVAGMPHNPARTNPLFQAETCDLPLNRFTYTAMVSLTLDHLIRWVVDGVKPPRAARISVPGGPGTPIELDEHGNAVGGVRTTWVDVPVATLSPLNTDTAPPANPFCGVFGSQVPFSAEKLRDLHRNHRIYVKRVNKRLDKLIRKGWYLREFAPELRDEAAAFEGFGEEGGG